MSVLVHRMLGDMVVNAKPGFACGEEDPEGIFQIRMNNIARSGALELFKKRYVPAGHKAVTSTLLRSGDILFNATNSPDLVGKTLLFPGLDEPTVFSNHFLRLRVDEEEIAPAYLARWLQAQFQRGVFKSMCRQWVNQATVGRDALLGLSLPVPPLAVQCRIISALDRIEALQEKRRDALSLLSDLVQSAFLDTFGDPRVNPMGWPVREFGKAVAGFRYGTSNKSGPEGRPVLRIPNVLGGSLDLSEVKTVSVSNVEFERLRLVDGDLLFVRTNGNPDYVGRCATFDGEVASRATGYKQDEFVYASYLIRARVLPELLRPIYAREYLLSSAGRSALRTRSKTSAGQFNINIQGLSDVPILLPPVELQESFAQVVMGIEEMKQVHKRHLAKLDDLFDSVRDRAFRGELWPEDALPAA